MKKALLFLVTAVAVALLVVSLRPSKTVVTPSPVAFKLPTGGDFEIPSTVGSYKTAEKRGKVLFLFFGFAHCPHVCPMTVSNLDRMIQSLPEASRNKVEVLFVSIDPEQDSLESLAKYLKPFKTPIVAATDTHEHLKKISSLFGARYSRIPSGDSFMIDHTNQVFVINSRGEWVETLEFDVPPAEYRQALETADDKKPLADRQISLKNVTLLAENTSCDLATQDACEIKTAEGTFEMIMNPRPVHELQTTSVTVRTNDSEWLPLLLDLEGIEQDMGFIRPSLAKADSGFKASFELPVCEIKTMQWRIRLVVQNKSGEKKALLFYMKTVRQ
ncbi:MAG: SCO family protein [Bdellovibrio sp.]|nr:SCO family protein [Bdellovibrio sp.]